MFRFNPRPCARGDVGNGGGRVQRQSARAKPKPSPGDPTLEIKRTLVRPKPEGEKVTFDVPPIVTQELWRRANDLLARKGPRQGQAGKEDSGPAEGSVLCPLCHKPMAVLSRRNGRVYYYCRSHYRSWAKDPCPYNTFVPATWDDKIWSEICHLLKDDTWVERQLAVELRKNEGAERLIRLQQLRIQQAEAKLRRVEQGFDGGFYTLEEARGRKSEYHQRTEEARQEIARLRAQAEAQGISRDMAAALRDELRALRSRNLEEAPFQERAEVIAMLGIKVYPSEALKSRRVACRINLPKLAQREPENPASSFAKRVIGGAYGICHYLLCSVLTDTFSEHTVKMAMIGAISE